jgi:tripartite-type tricarboxylate transporter receptor subunit TctC
MKIQRRHFLHLAAGAAALPGVTCIATAQTYPMRPVHIIVGFAPGGAPDIVARSMGQWLSDRLGQPFVIENRTGAGGNIATEAVVGALPDGHTLLLVTPGNAINATLYERLNYNFIRDIAPVAGVIRVPNVMEVTPSLPVQTVSEPGTMYRRSIRTLALSEAAVCFPTGQTQRTCFAARQPMWIAFSGAKSRVTCQFNCRSNS